MRTLPFRQILLSVALSACYGQIPDISAIPVAPVPQDPLELVTGPTAVPATAAERGALVVLLNRAVDHYSLHARGTRPTFSRFRSTPPHPRCFKAAPDIFARLGFPARTGAGMEPCRATPFSGSARMAPSSTRIADSLIPLRMKMLANAIFLPVAGAPRRETLRTTSVTWKGAQITCILTSATKQPAGANEWAPVV